MPITPITANAQMDLHYTVDGLPHIIQLRCHKVGVSGGNQLLGQSSGSQITAPDAADMAFTLLGPLYKAANTSFDQWVLQSYADGIYNPLQQGSTAVVPTDTAAIQQAQQATYTFVDSHFQKVRLILLENRVTPANKYAYADLGGAYKTLADSMLSEADTDLGSWVTGREGDVNLTFTFLSLVTTYNKRLRRKRGLS